MGNLSNNHYSNYPPISQYLFQFIAYFNRGDILRPIFALRIIYMFGELFLFFGAKILFEHFKIPSINIAWYFLNPLVIVEGFGNLHGEPLMITFTCNCLIFFDVISIWELDNVYLRWHLYIIIFTKL